MSREIPVWYNKIGEKELNAIVAAGKSGHIMEGPVLKEFQNMICDYLGVKYALGTSSGTSALTLALMAIGINPGDEVIVPDLTFIATANAASILGAKVMVAPTVNGGTLIDINKLENCLTEKTRAVISVDLNGRMVDVNRIKKICCKKGIAVISDSCQAFGSKSHMGMAGTLADISCFSFGITKTLTTIKGGAVVTNSNELYEKMALLKTQGMKSVFEGDKYYAPGYNFKLPDVLAAVGIAQLNTIEQRINHMKELDKLYQEKLRDVDGISFLDRNTDELIWMSDIVCDNRESVRERLNSMGIQCRPLGSPLHTAEYLYSVPEVRYYSYNIQPRMLALPSGPDTDISAVAAVTAALNIYE